MRIPRLVLTRANIVKSVLLGWIGLIILSLALVYELPNTYVAYTNEDAVVVISSPRFYGSGVCVDPSGIIVTAAHMVRDFPLTITFPNGEAYFPYDIYIDSHRDVAICRIEAGKPLPYLELGNSSELVPGDEIEIIGAPLGVKWWHSYGHISRIPYNGDIYMDIAGNFGNSGCPVIHNNKMIGILTAKFIDADGLILGVESDYIKLVLDVYKFFDSVEAKSPFLDFVKQAQQWLMKPDNISIVK